MTNKNEPKDLDKKIKDLLNGSLGASTSNYEWPKKLNPVGTGIAMGVMCFVFIVVPQFFIPCARKELMVISYWSAAYTAIAAFIAKTTSLKIFRIIQNDILPFFSDVTRKKISDDLTRQYAAKPINRISISSSIIMTVACSVAIWFDLNSKSSPCPHTALWLYIQLTLWSFGNLLIFRYAARATYVARFYTLFGENLKMEIDKLFSLNPLKTPLVKSIASVGTYIINFWFVIALTISFLIILAFITDISVKYFIYVMVPVTSFFSLIFGSLVFYENWYKLRNVTDQVTKGAILKIQNEATVLFEGIGNIDQAKLTKLQDLLELQDNVLLSQQNKIALGAILSFLSPLIGLIATILKVYLDSSSRIH